MPTTYTTRPVINTSYNITRLGGSYLKNNAGQYILTKAGQKIIVKVPGGTKNITVWSTRPII